MMWAHAGGEVVCWGRIVFEEWGCNLAGKYDIIYSNNGKRGKKLQKFFIHGV